MSVVWAVRAWGQGVTAEVRTQSPPVIFLVRLILVLCLDSGSETSSEIKSRSVQVRGINISLDTLLLCCPFIQVGGFEPRADRG